MVSFKSVLKVFIYDQTNVHDIFVVYASDHTVELWLHFVKSFDEVCQSFVSPLTLLNAVNDFICQVDVSLNQIHVIDKLLVLFRNVDISFWFRLLLFLHWRWSGKLHAAALESFVDLTEEGHAVSPAFVLESPFLNEADNFHLNLNL